MNRRLKRIPDVRCKLKPAAIAALALALAIASLAGCSENDAEKLARDTSQSVSALSHQVDLKVSAEKAFYATEQAAILNRNFGCSWCPPPNPPSGDPKAATATPSDSAHANKEPAAAGTPAVSLGQVCPVQSLYYLTIANQTQADADMTAAKIIESPKDAMSLVLSFQQQGLAEQSATYAQLLQQYQDAQKQLNNVQQIQEQADKLTAVRNDLATLASSNTPVENLKMLFTLGSTVESQIQGKSNQKQPTPSASPAAPAKK